MTDDPSPLTMRSGEQPGAGVAQRWGRAMSFWLTETQHPNGPVFVVTHGQHDASSKRISEDDALLLWKQARADQVIFTTAAANWVKFKLHAMEDGLC